MTVVRFDQAHRPHRNRAEVGEALNRSLDLADHAERLRQCGNALQRALHQAADEVDRAHWAPEPHEAPAALNTARIALLHAYSDVIECANNFTLRSAHADAVGTKAVAEAVDDFLPTFVAPGA